MANTYVDYTASASQTDFAFSFPYLEDTHVVVEIDGIDKTITTDFTIPSVGLVRLNSGATAGQAVRVKRISDFATDLVNFVNGSVLNEADLDRAYQHNRYLNEEAAEGNSASMQLVGGGTDYNAKNKKIVNLATPTADNDAVNKSYIDERIALSGTALNGFNKSTHTGDNTETQFTLSFTAQVSTPEAYLVTIDGVVQTPTTAYSVDTSNNKITFTSAPPTSSNIVVVPIGTTSSANDATVVATGSTASRSLADRFDDVLNVLDYGASPSETATNNTTAIQNAINDARTSRKTVYIPSAEGLTYEINELYLDGTGIHIRGDNRWGTKLKYNGSSAAITVSSDGTTSFEFSSIRDLGFVCNNTASNTAINIDKAPTTVLEDLLITEYNTGIYAQDAWNTSCENIYMANIRDRGFDFRSNCNDTSFVNCVIDGTDNGRGLYAESCHGISWKGGAIEDFEYAYEFQNCEVTIDVYAESNPSGVIYVPTGTRTQVNILNLYSFGNAPSGSLITAATGFIKVHQLHDGTIATQPSKVFNLTGGAKAYYGELNVDSSVDIGTCDPASGGKIKPLYEVPTTRYVSGHIDLALGVTETFYIGNVFRPWKIGSIKVIQLSGSLANASDSTIRTKFNLGVEGNLTAFCNNVSLTNAGPGALPNQQAVSFTQTSIPYTNQTGPMVFSLTGENTAKVQVIIDYYTGYAKSSVANYNDINTFLTTNGGNGESIPLNSLV